VGWKPGRVRGAMSAFMRPTLGAFRASARATGGGATSSVSVQRKRLGLSCAEGDVFGRPGRVPFWAAARWPCRLPTVLAALPTVLAALRRTAGGVEGCSWRRLRCGDWAGSVDGEGEPRRILSAGDESAR